MFRAVMIYGKNAWTNFSGTNCALTDCACQERQPEAAMTHERQTDRAQQIQGGKAKQAPARAKAPPHKRSQSVKRREAAKENESSQGGGVRQRSGL